MMTAREILEELNESDERRSIEAKACSSGKLGNPFLKPSAPLQMSRTWGAAIFC